MSDVQSIALTNLNCEAQVTPEAILRPPIFKPNMGTHLNMPAAIPQMKSTVTSAQVAEQTNMQMTNHSDAILMTNQIPGNTSTELNMDTTTIPELITDENITMKAGLLKEALDVLSGMISANRIKRKRTKEDDDALVSMILKHNDILSALTTACELLKVGSLFLPSPT